MLNIYICNSDSFNSFTCNSFTYKQLFPNSRIIVNLSKVIPLTVLPGTVVVTVCKSYICYKYHIFLWWKQLFQLLSHYVLYTIL